MNPNYPLVVLAKAHYAKIGEYSKKAATEIACIRQLLVGREVLFRGGHYRVTEVRWCGPTGVELLGIRRGAKRRVRMGPFADVEAVLP